VRCIYYKPESKAVIALWLGHASIETTHIYVEKELGDEGNRALEKVAQRLPGSDDIGPMMHSWPFSLALIFRVLLD